LYDQGLISCLPHLAPGAGVLVLAESIENTFPLMANWGDFTSWQPAVLAGWSYFHVGGLSPAWLAGTMGVQEVRFLDGRDPKQLVDFLAAHLAF